MSFTVWFFQGSKAYQDGLPIEDNPHMPDTPEYDAWDDGWITAMSDDMDGEIEDDLDFEDDDDLDGGW